MAILSIEQLMSPQYLSVAVVGSPKTGKTQSLHTLWDVFEHHKMPNDRIVIHDFDEDGSVPVIRKAIERFKTPEAIAQHLTVHRYRRRAGEKIKDANAPNRWSDEWKEFQNEHNRYYDMLDSVTQHWRDPVHAPGAIVLDSMTNMQDLVWNAILSSRNKEVGVGKAQEGQTQGPIGFDEWNLLRGKMVETIKSVKALPCYGIFLFHENLKQEEVKGLMGQPETDIVTGRSFYLPMIVGQLAFDILKEFSVSVTTTYQGSKYRWQVVPDDKHPSLGSRAVDAFKDRLIDQDFTLVMG